MPVSENRIRLDSVFPSLSPEKHYICEVNDKPHINMEHNILIPLLLTLGAGLATGIGSAIAFFARRTNKRLLSFSLGLSGGVMIYVSFVELFQQAQITLSEEWGRYALFLFSESKDRASDAPYCRAAERSEGCERGSVSRSAEPSVKRVEL